jgi:hypothetical protein
MDHNGSVAAEVLAFELSVEVGVVESAAPR